MSTTTERPPMNDCVLKAANGEPTDYVPVWTMRQAGRYLPEFREARLASDFFTICQTPALACEVTLQPLRRFELDASIIFSDILVVPQALGMEVQMVKGVGPHFPTPLVVPEDMEKLIKNPDVDKVLGYVYDAITLTKKSMEKPVPIYGFCGGPFTVMGYMIEGGGSKNYSKCKTWLYKYPEATKELLDILTKNSITYLVGQAKAGADLLQIFESNAGELNQEAFNQFCLPYLTKIVVEVKAELKKQGIPTVPMSVFARGSHYALEDLAKTDYEIIQVDWTINPADARRRVGDKKTLQGNLDPCILYASDEDIKKHVETMIKGFGTQKYIANLGHGMHPTHKPEKLKVFVDAVHEVSKRMNAM